MELSESIRRAVDQWMPGRHPAWVKTDVDGSFTIPNIRPGSYTLYSFLNGAVGEYSQSGVSVDAGQTTGLGDVTWDVFHPGSGIAWEIGIPDRDSIEFRHGNDYFEPFLFQQFATEFSGPLDYTVGVSDWSTDWNFAQTQSIEPGMS